MADLVSEMDGLRQFVLENTDLNELIKLFAYSDYR